MNKNYLNVLTAVTSTSGVAYFLDNMETIIGIVVGILTLISISLTIFSNIKARINNDGKLDEQEKKDTVNELKEANEKLQELKEQIEKLKGGK